ncbi:MAG: hypothetical protein RR645_02975 [Clostridium sp.]
MELKEIKIFIPEIPKEWEHRTRSGNTNIWNDSFHRNGLTEVRLEPPIRGLYAERFEDGWYWVCGCNKCLGNNKSYSYIVCEEHDCCIACGTHRKDLTETPWGHPSGFQCKPCADKKHEKQKEEALLEAVKKGHSEDDCCRRDEIICPKCASECSDDDMNEQREYEITCYVCDAEFIVEVEYAVEYTSRFK